MTQSSWFWNGMATGDAAISPYDSALLAKLDRYRLTPYPENQGIIGNSAAKEMIITTGGTPTTVVLNYGNAVVNGRYYFNNNAMGLTLTMATMPDTWWSVVLRSDATLQTVRAAIKGPYISEAIAVAALTQTEDVWEIPVASVYQRSGLVPLVYDQRHFIIRNYTRSFLVPALGGYNSTGAIDIVVNNEMGLHMPHLDSGIHVLTEAYGQFIVPEDYGSWLYVTPLVIPLGAMAVGTSEVNVEQAYDWGALDESYSTHNYVSGYSSPTIVNQIVNEPLTSYHVTPLSVGDLVCCGFFRRATNAGDTFTGSLYMPGWLVQYYSSI